MRSAVLAGPLFYTTPLEGFVLPYGDVAPPAFPIDKALGQMRLAGWNTRSVGSIVDSIERRSRNFPGDWAARARAIAQQEIAPAPTVA